VDIAATSPELDREVKPTIQRLRDGAYELRSQIFLEATIEDVFSFFADPTNLNLITPEWLDFRIVTSTPISMCTDATIEYKLKLRSIPVSWKSIIPVWEPPFKFTDRQLRGPYTSWIHDHLFSEINPDLTCVEDRVLYRVPTGRLAHFLFVKRDLLRIFDYRAHSLKEIFR